MKGKNDKNDKEDNIDEILLKIQEQEDQKNTLSTFINSISDNSEKNNYIADCNKILELINTNIKSLSSIGMLLNNLKEKSLTNHLENIQANIKEYTDEITKYSDILKNNTIETEINVDSLWLIPQRDKTGKHKNRKCKHRNKGTKQKTKTNQRNTRKKTTKNRKRIN